jgi:hypothetical protein
VTSPEHIHQAIKSAAREGEGFGGQCAAFAVVLNRILGGEGIYLAADGQHYEYVEHIALLYDGEIYDGSGRIEREDLAEYADPEDGDDPEIIEIDDDADIRAMVDSSGGGIYPTLNEESLEMRLRAALAEAVNAAKP